jgi:hypothetical protein
MAVCPPDYNNIMPQKHIKVQVKLAENGWQYMLIGGNYVNISLVFLSGFLVPSRSKYIWSLPNILAYRLTITSQ